MSDDILADAVELATSRAPAEAPQAAAPLAFESSSAPPNPDDEPLVYRPIPAPGIVAQLEHRDVDPDQGGRRELVPAWNALKLVPKLQDGVAQKVATVRSDPELTHKGEKAKLTREAIVSNTKELRSHKVALEQHTAVLEGRLRALVPANGVPVASPEERAEDARIAEAVGAEIRLAVANARGDSKARLDALDRELRDERVRLACARTPAIIWGGTPGQDARLRESYQPKLTGNQVAEQQRLRADLAINTAALEYVTKVEDGWYRIADRDVLRQAGLGRLTRADMNDAAKVAFLNEYGYEAFTKLPAK